MARLRAQNDDLQKETASLREQLLQEREKLQEERTRNDASKAAAAATVAAAKAQVTALRQQLQRRSTPGPMLIPESREASVPPLDTRLPSTTATRGAVDTATPAKKGSGVFQRRTRNKKASAAAAPPAPKEAKEAATAEDLLFAIFDALDQDATGYLSNEQERMYLISSGCDESSPQFAQYLEHFVTSADADRDGKVSRDDYCRYMVEGEDLDKGGRFKDRSMENILRNQLKALHLKHSAT